MEWRFVHPDINEWPLGRVSNAGSNPARCTKFMCESQISDGTCKSSLKSKVWWKSERTHFHTPSLRAYILGTEEASASLVHNVQKTWLGLLMRFQLRPTKFCECRQEKVTLSRFLRRTKAVEGCGVVTRLIAWVGSAYNEYHLDRYPKWRITSRPD